MDHPKRTKKDRKKHPRVPIKTYKWEDIRRSRRKGGYPWTYLYKQPFDEQLDPEPFTMSALRKSKSSSTVEKSEGVQISDVTENENGEGKMDTLQIVTEPDDMSARNSIGSITIEECDMSDIGEAETQKPENIALESADSSDNISQYLDKDERGPDKEPELKTNLTEGNTEDEMEEKESQNLTNEEQSKRKRKMSEESSYSRISSTKQAVLNKIREAKNKIKVPKLSFTVIKRKPPIRKTATSEPKKQPLQKDTKKHSLQPKNIKPVYIHIPLKPPPGQTDEFSYLEFEDKAQTTSPQIKGVGSFKFLAKNIKRLQETIPNTEQTVEEEPASKTLKKNDDTVPEDKDIISEYNDTPRDEVVGNNLETTNSSISNGQESKSQEDKDVNAEKEDALNVSLTDTEDLSKDAKINLELCEEGTLDEKDIVKTSTETIEGSSIQPLQSQQPQKGILKTKQERAKSEEPEKKRKLSLESSYSRKSLSKLEIMKKLRETSEKIKKTFSINRKKKPLVESVTPEKENLSKKPPKKERKSDQHVKPVYIHIPLKPEVEEETMQDENKQQSNSPDSPVKNDVQFIMLTAPSDDEVLDDHNSDVPETPSSDKKIFFENKIDELKKLAKDVVDDITVTKTSQKLDPVAEETLNGNNNNGDNGVTFLPTEQKLEIVTQEISDDHKQAEEMQAEKEEIIPKKCEQANDRTNIMIDVEDGLSESYIKEDKQELTKVVSQPGESKPGEGSKTNANLNLENPPSIKKKVSFKRRSKTPKDGSYEDIGPNKPSEVLNEPNEQQTSEEVSVTDGTQSPSEEKQIFLDREKTVLSKEDEDKWSNISDHEYEPVNPPPEVQIFSSIPTLNVVEEKNNVHFDNRYPEVPRVRYDLPVNEEETHRTDPTDEKEPLRDVSIHTQADDGQIQDATDKNKDPNKFQLAWKQTTNQFKNKLLSMKKHHPSGESKPRNTKKPQPSEENKPKSRKFKFEKPKFNLPKIPDTTKINLPSLPSFNLPRRSSTKRSLKDRQLSTESNAGDSKKISFDFSTYPIFKKKPKPKTDQKQEEFLDLASDPRQTQQEIKSLSSIEVTRIPLHSEESVSDENIEKLNLSETLNREEGDGYDDKNEYLDDDHTASHIRYKDDIDIDDEFESQDINNDEYLDRWNRGNFNPDLDIDYTKQFANARYEVTDLDFPDDMDRQSFDYNSNHNKERYSSGSSFGGQRVGGVLEEINPDEFFLRQKGISQDNIEVGMYLSSEIKEAFRTPENALTKMEDRDFTLNISNQSLPETQNKRKPVRKPKRKKTPQVSQERISFGESDDEDIDVTPPSRPKRRSRRNQKHKNFGDIVPYQETIPVETNIPTEVSNEENNSHFLKNYERTIEDDRESEVLGHREFNPADADDLNFEYIDENQLEKPAAPPRKHKSLKSLTSENESILEEITSQMVTPEIDIKTSRKDPAFATPTTYPLKRPSRKKSRSSLQSETSLQSKESIQKEEDNSQLLTSENQIPCVEEPCVQDIRDHMGYAIIDKQKVRDPPLPPPRTPSRKKRSTKPTESNFFTVPRQTRYDDMPVRPLRNYSTLGQAKKIGEPVTYENKENIIQYVEIEDEHNRDLQSGDVIQKMKDRPLPAPPRPPRKSRILQNITSKENIMSDITSETPPHEEVDEDENEKYLSSVDGTELENNGAYTTEKRLITPDYFTHHETITHGSLLVQSLDGDKILPDSELTSRSEERIIPVSIESDDETSSVPEDFKKLKDPPEERNIQIVSNTNPEIEVLKAHKLQVIDLDVDTLTVNKLLAGKIIVSEIDSHSIRTDEIHSKSDKTRSAEKVDIPGKVLEDESTTLQKSQSLQVEERVENKQENIDNSSTIFDEEKKTPTNVIDLQALNESIQIDLENVTYLETADEPSSASITTKDNGQDQIDSFNQDNEFLHSDPPIPPPRSLATNLENNLESSEYSHRLPPQFEEIMYTTSNDEVMQEPEVDDEPPPRPPQPHLDYIPSQPPPSFYALRAQKYVDSAESNIPKVPRRKRPPRSISRSSSEDSLVTPISRRLHNRSPEPSISQLSGQLIRTCGSTAHSALKRLITDITNNLKKNSDGKLDLHVMTIILLILIAGLILLGYGEEKTVVHLHHWEYFNPPKDL